MKMAVDSFVKYLVSQKRVSNNTLQSYTRDLKQFKLYLNEVNINDLLKVNQATIITYMIYMRRLGKANSSILRSLATLRCFYSHMIENGLINEDPTLNLDLPKSDRPQIEILNQKETETLLDQPECKDFKGYRDKAMLELLYATGLKVSELINLNVCDISLEESYITCGNTKKREVPLGSMAAEALKNYMGSARTKMFFDTSEKDALFLNQNGKRLTRQGFWKIIKGYKEKANINKEVTPHTLRHSFAVHLIENGADVGAVKEMLGHTALSTTKYYTKLVEKRLDEVYKKAHPRA